MLPKEKDDDRLLASAVMLLRIAACAPTTEMDFQSVEIVLMRWSTASLLFPSIAFHFDIGGIKDK
jgi:hypothetical protein